MSSGNPFRRSKVDNNDYAQRKYRHAVYQRNVHSRQTLRHHVQLVTTLKKSPRKKAKKVQIISPNSSPIDSYKPTPRRLSDGGTGSPPPERNTEDDTESSGVESTATEDEYLERAVENTRRNSGSDPLSPPIPASSSSSTSDTASNPFAKRATAAAPQVSFGISTIRTKTNIELDNEDEGPKGEKEAAAGPAMDVDAFKNMLLTGKAPALVEKTHSQGVKNSNGVDTTDSGGSDTRASMIEPAYGLTSDLSPIAPDDHSASESESDDYDGHEDDDTHDHSTLMGAGRSEDIAPALPPKHQPSGKAKKGPQTVSFADFEETIPPPEYGPASPEIARPDPAFWVNRPPLERHGSDLNKPLPPPPPSFPEPPPQKVAEESHGSATLGASTPPTSILPQASKKAAPPPPPPASRRHGQTSGTNFTPQPPSSRSRARSNSSLDSANLRIGDTDQAVATPPTELSAKLAAIPPPPPSRRQHNASVSVAEQPQSQTSEESLLVSTEQRSSLSSSPQTTPIGKPTPPPPPRRNLSSKGRGSTINRTPSNSSRSSLLQNEPAPGISHYASASAPAPPPPRRGAGQGTASSNRSSLDINHRRASGQSVGSYQSQRSASPSSLQPLKHDELSHSIEGHNGGEGLPRDILADMTAFQKEIDELRARALSNA
ncbi:hypothetical protein K431DRAFT_307126 [Polychaeton citri CBS 116435]|uniref:Uncharacterized protein n=1 Tax=Polychaeton citri CBS 116435 TaxID=1314669 RepID=A0A9P4UK91_9PEZI|nr:hypothetical protein K431DRAFT_307126 [Polychaeton citri CBS 116435]